MDGVSQGALGLHVYERDGRSHDHGGLRDQRIHHHADGGANGSITPGAPQTVKLFGHSGFHDHAGHGLPRAGGGRGRRHARRVGGYTFTNVMANHTITAAFGINTYTLTMTTTAFIVNSSTPTVTIPGAGSAGITPTVGANAFSYGTIVTLTAVALPAWSFSGWTGDADCVDGVVTMTTDMSCAARFETRAVYVPMIGTIGRVRIADHG